MLQSILHPVPLQKPFLLFVYLLITVTCGVFIDYKTDTRLDASFHDAAVVQTPRESWQHVSMVALDPGVPGFISRRQALPLYALAAQRVFTMGATAVFLDAVLYEFDGRTSYAMCIEDYQAPPLPNQFRWQQSVQLQPFALLNEEQFQRFFIARPKFAGQDDFVTTSLLQSYFGEGLLPLDFFEPENNGQQVNRLIADASVHKRDGGTFDASFRWMNLTENAVVPKVTQIHIEQHGIEADYSFTETCDNTPCKRVRFSHPKYQFETQPSLPLIPISKLLSCDSFNPDDNLQQQVKDRIVILQMTEPTEATDIKVTPMLSALGSPGLFLSGPQFLADAVETVMQKDAPARPDFHWRALLIMLISVLSIAVAAYLRTAIAFFSPLVALLMAWSLCFVTAPNQLWPVMACALSALLGTSLVLATHISLGTAKAKLMAQYIPRQIRSLLLNNRGNAKFIHKHIDAVILMSDIARYSDVTSELKDPAYVFQLLNDYFQETTLATQNEYAGWLESYVGDMVCFYWPVHEGTTLEAQQRLALAGAIDMAQKQRQFFAKLAKDPEFAIPSDTLKKISDFIGAGIGVTSGQVMMGNLGPENGIQKFGCLGDPLNLASRTESLTRHFNCEILVTEELVPIAQEMALATRFVASVVVKGRLSPIGLYALGEASDPRFTQEKLHAWQQWQSAFCQGKKPEWPALPAEFQQDRDTLQNWMQQGLWDPQQACFQLKQK